MTASVVGGITIRPWRGYDDPGLPVGMYFAQNTVLGDATGGDMIVFFEFRGEGEPLSGRFFNIEQFNVFHTDLTTRFGHVGLNNFEDPGPTGLVNRQWRFELENNANAFAALNSQIYFPLPLFLGAAGPLLGIPAEVEIGTDNINMATLFATIQGYIWEARSVQAEGGLRRPVDSLYGGGRG